MFTFYHSDYFLQKIVHNQFISEEGGGRSEKEVYNSILRNAIHIINVKHSLHLHLILWEVD